MRAWQGIVNCVGLVAGPLSQWLYRHLAEATFETVVMDTRQVKGALKRIGVVLHRMWRDETPFLFTRAEPIIA